MHLSQQLGRQLGRELRRHLALFILGILAALNLTACSGEKYSPPQGGKFWGIFAPTEVRAPGLRIVGADLEALPGAKVLIGSELDHPFAGNFLVADAAGYIELPSGWTEAAAVTIEAPGYIRATYFGQTPGDRTYRLRKKNAAITQQFEVTGLTTGHNIVEKDGYVDFSMVIPALTRNDFLSFGMDTVISPQADIMSILGQDTEVPSNFTFPKQKENYFLPVTIEKPVYRVYLPEGGAQKVFAARGRFPFKSTVDKLRKDAKIQDVVNDFTLMGGGVKDLMISGPRTKVDIGVKEFDFKHKISVAAPSFAGDETLLVVGVAHMNEYMIPTDVKNFKSGEKKHIVALDATASVFSVLKKTKDIESDEPGSDRLSAALVPAAGGAAPALLPILGDPALAGNGDLLLPKMNSIRGVNPLATYAVISQIRDGSQGKEKIEVYDKYWEMYAPRWAEVVSLPQWPEGQHLPGKKLWEVTLIGGSNVSDVDLGPAMVNNASHVTHSSLEF